MKTLIVDGTNILVRGIKALEGRVGLSAHGVPTGPLMVFINSMGRYIGEEKPDRVVVCWDGGRSTYRTSIYSAYKAARADRVVETEHEHFGLAKQFLALANIYQTEMEGVEADDLVAAYWRSSDPFEHTVILSGDKDFLQLLDGRTEQIRPQTAGNERWNTERVLADLGCTPFDIPSVMALTGDSGDGVPGVPGFGHKTACKALAAHDWSLTDLLMTNDAKWVKKISGYQDQVLMARKLVDLRGNNLGLSLPVPPHFNPVQPDSGLGQDLIAFFEHWEMRRVIDRFRANTLWRDMAGEFESSHRLR